MELDHNVLHHLRSEYEQLVRECKTDVSYTGGDGIESCIVLPNLESGVMGLMDVLYGNAGEQTLPSAQKLLKNAAKSFKEILFLEDNPNAAAYTALHESTFLVGPTENMPTFYFDSWTMTLNPFIHNQLESSTLFFFRGLSTNKKGKKTQGNQRTVNFFDKIQYSPTSNMKNMGFVFKNVGNLSPRMEYATILRLTRLSEMTGIALGDFFSKYSKVTIGKEDAK